MTIANCKFKNEEVAAMSHPIDTPGEPAHPSWPHALTCLVGYQWKLWGVPYQIGMEIVESVLKSSTEIREEEKPVQTGSKPGSSLEQLAAQRVQQGLPPPREIYALPCRDRINWSDFPAWARPTDPELFEGCSHEG
jgi:hypothetical protein